MDVGTGLRCPWQAAFEVEIILGDLGDERFSNAGHLLEASQSYTRELARILVAKTSKPWKALRSKSDKPGYAVLAKPNMSSSDFTHECQIAGIVLLTPPLPLMEAETLRRDLQAIVAGLDGRLDRSTEMNRRFAWKIVVHCEDRLLPVHVDPVRLSTFVDEIALLAASGRTGLRGNSPQRHAYGAGLLHDLAAEPSLFAADVNLEALIRCHCDPNPSGAARFGSGGVARLAHFGVNDFFSDTPLEALLSPVLASFEASTKVTHRGLQHLLSVFLTLKEWLSHLQDEIVLEMGGLGGFSFSREGAILFKGAEVGRASWQGSLDIELRLGDDLFCHPVRMFGQRLSDIAPCVALLCLDAVEIGWSTGKLPLEDGPLYQATLDLEKRLGNAGLLKRPSPATPL